MRALQAAVIVMGILIVAGVAVVGLTIARRLTAAPGGTNVTLDEPEGTRIVSAGLASDRLAMVLQGGGPDRVVLIDPRTGAVAGRIGLAR